MEVTFKRVTITIVGVGGPKEAYDRLCNALASIEGDKTTGKQREVTWCSDTFVTSDQGAVRTRPVSSIYPTEEEYGVDIRKD